MKQPRKDAACLNRGLLMDLRSTVFSLAPALLNCQDDMDLTVTCHHITAVSVSA